MTKQVLVFIFSIFIVFYFTCTNRDFDNPLDPDAIIPPPSDLNIIMDSNTEARISWRDNSNNENGFVIERKYGRDTFQELARVSANQTNYVDNSLPMPNFGIVTTYRVYSFVLLAGGEQRQSVKVEKSIAAIPEAEIVQTLIGHENFVSALDFSPDGSFLISASFDQTIRLWQLEEGIGIFTFTNHSSEINSVVLSPDGTLAASASNDGEILVWNIRDGSIFMTIPNQVSVTGPVNSVAFSPDASLLASGAADGRVRIWDLTFYGVELRELVAHSGDSYSVAFSPDGLYLASGGRDGTTEMWRVSDGTNLYTLSDQSDYAVFSVAFSPDSRLLASGTTGGVIRLWSVTNGSNVLTFSAHSGYGVISLAFNHDGTILASGGADGTISLWRVFDGGLLKTLSINPVDEGPVPPRDLSPVSFSPDGLLLATSSDSDTIQVRSMENHWEIPQ